MAKPSSLPRPHRAASLPEARVPARREEVLDAALALIAERGVAGASLRELAARLEMSQPSLYHYFESKDELVQQILDRCAEAMLTPAHGQLPSERSELPRFVADVVIGMWSEDRHPTFVRFLFAVAADGPERKAMMRRTLEDRLNPAFEIFARGFSRTDADAHELAHVLRMVTFAIAFPLLEERAILGVAKPSERILEYADWVVRAGERLIEAGPAAAMGTRPRKRS